jgi:hypothetical protein
LYRRKTAQHGEALELLRSLPDSCTPLVFFDRQHRDVLDKLKYGNESARSSGAFSSAVTSPIGRAGRLYGDVLYATYRR